MTRRQTGCYPAICSVTSMNVDWRSFLALGRSFALILCVFLYHLQQNITKKWFMQMPHPCPANWSCHQWSHRIVSCSWVAERQWWYAVTAQRFTNKIFTMSQVGNLHKGGPEWHKCVFYTSICLCMLNGHCVAVWSQHFQKHSITESIFSGQVRSTY